VVLLVVLLKDMGLCREKAYVLLVAAEVELTPLALVAKAGDVVGQVEARTFLGEDSRRECSRAGHV
jgi:hypothetical protein